MTRVALDKIDKECSLSQWEWVIYNIYFHPENKSSVTQIKSMTIEEVLSYKEAIEAVSLLKEAAQKDHDLETSQKSRLK